MSTRNEVSQNVSNPLRTGVHQHMFMVNERGYIVFDCIEEMEYAYDAMLQLVLEQPRYFLDNLDYVKEFQVSWLNYSSKEYCDKVGRYYAVSYPRKYCSVDRSKSL